MNKTALVFALLLPIQAMAQTPAQAPAPAKPSEQPAIAKTLGDCLSILERVLVPIAEAMPEDKYDFVPTTGEFKGVRSFAQQVKHIAGGNYGFGSQILGEKAPDAPVTIKTKAEIVQYLKDSFAYMHKAIATINDQNAHVILNSQGGINLTRLFLAVQNENHGFDHYGQLVVYLRMNGIIPPMSRR